MSSSSTMVEGSNTRLACPLYVIIALTASVVIGAVDARGHNPNGVPITNVSRVTVPRYSTAVLGCDLEDKGEPEGTGMWLRRSRQPIRENPLNLYATEYTQAGDYFCYFQNEYGASMFSLSVKVQVIGRLSNDVEINVHSPTLHINQELVVGCVLTTIPGSYMTLWTPQDYRSSNKPFTIRVTSFKQSGRYYCEGYEDPIFKSAYVDISVEGAPFGTPTIRGTQSFLYINQTLKLHCSIEEVGGPEGVVVWRTSTGSPVSGNPLIIHATSYTQSGNYSCVFRNHFGSSNWSSPNYITIYGRPFGTPSINVTSVSLLLHGSLIVYCELKEKGYPKGSVQWRTPAEVINGVNPLVIDAMFLNQSGHYSCRFENSNGTSNWSMAAFIQIKDPSSSSSSTTGTFVLYVLPVVGFVVLVLCIAVAVCAFRSLRKGQKEKHPTSPTDSIQFIPSRTSDHNQNTGKKRTGAFPSFMSLSKQRKGIEKPNSSGPSTAVTNVNITAPQPIYINAGVFHQPEENPVYSEPKEKHPAVQDSQLEYLELEFVDQPSGTIHGAQGYSTEYVDVQPECS